MVVIVYAGTTCVNSVPIVTSASPDYFSDSASYDTVLVQNQTSGNLFMDIITNPGPSEMSGGKQRQCVLH